jgi:hypothetical protein
MHKSIEPVRQINCPTSKWIMSVSQKGALTCGGSTCLSQGWLACILHIGHDLGSAHLHGTESFWLSWGFTHLKFKGFQSTPWWMIYDAKHLGAKLWSWSNRKHAGSLSMDFCNESHVCMAVYCVNRQITMPGRQGMFKNACLYASGWTRVWDSSASRDHLVDGSAIEVSNRLHSMRVWLASTLCEDIAESRVYSLRYSQDNPCESSNNDGNSKSDVAPIVYWSKPAGSLEYSVAACVALQGL